MSTWLSDFFERSDLSKYPVALRTRGGIGFQVGSVVVSNFVGHPVHYLDGREWKPITLKHENGQFEGSHFGWNGYAVTYRKKVLYQPESITFNGVMRPLEFFREDNRLIATVSNIGIYEIIFSERGVKELLTIPEPIEGELSFQVAHAAKPKGLHKHGRRIMQLDGFEGDVYQLTKDMPYPLTIDPDYSDTTSDGDVFGQDATYATARSTTVGYASMSTVVGVGQNFLYTVMRALLKFDTSGIPDADVISQVNMKLVCDVDSSTTDFDVVIQKHDWSGQDPISDSNREAAYDNCLSAAADNNIWRNTSGISTATQYTSGDLSTSWVSKTGYTFYGLISSRDVANITPDPATEESITIRSQEHATSAHRPVLTVTHASASRKSLALLGVG